MPKVDAGIIGDHRGFRLQRASEILHRIFAARAHLRHGGVVDVSGETRRVDMDVAAAGLDQARHDLPLDRNDVGQERLHVAIDRGRVFVFEALRDAVRPDQRDFSRRLRHLADEAVFLERNVVRKRQSRLGRPAMRHRRAGMMHLRDIPTLPRRRTLDALLVHFQRRAVGVIAFHRGAKAVLEIEPAHFAVGDHVEARVLLQPHRLAHRLIFDGVQRVRGDLAVVERNARFLDDLRPQQAADHVGADFGQCGLVLRRRFLNSGHAFSTIPRSQSVARTISVARRGRNEKTESKVARARWVSPKPDPGLHCR